MNQAPDASRKLIRDPDMVSTDMDGETVMMSIEQGEYYGLSGIGPFLWELMGQNITVDELCEKVVERYKVDDATCRKDVTKFVGQLLERGILRYAD